MLVPISILITGDTLISTFTSQAAIEFCVAFGASVAVDEFVIVAGYTGLLGETGGAVRRAW